MIGLVLCSCVQTIVGTVSSPAAENSSIALIACRTSYLHSEVKVVILFERVHGLLAGCGRKSSVRKMLAFSLKVVVPLIVPILGWILWKALFPVFHTFCGVVASTTLFQ